MFNFFCINIILAVVAYAASQNLESLMEVCLQERGTSPILLISNAKFPLFYEHLNYQWNERLGQILPLAILTAQSSLDVSNGIICGRELGIHIVPKSGGHSFEKYSHGDNSTIVIDLVNLRQITIERNALTADVGAGVLLAHLYAKAWNEAELGFVAGTCVSVGAALSLGAGYGHVAHIYGVTSDNVLEVEIVTADGEIRVVSENSNPDLFWALRGAGAGNFGIATRIKHQLFDASATNFTHIYIRYHNLTTFSQVFAAWDAWNYENINGTTTGLIMVRDSEQILIFVDVNMSEVQIENIVNSFPLGVTEVRNFNFIEMIVQASWPHVEAPEFPNVRRQDHPQSPYRAKSYYASKTLMDDELKRLGEVLINIPPNVIVHFNSYGGTIQRIPKNGTSFVHRDSLYSLLAEISDTSIEVDNWVEEFDRMVTEVIDNGESCQNFVDGELDDYLERYYGSNLDRLIEIKRNVDPHNVFHFPQSIPLVRK